MSFSLFCVSQVFSFSFSPYNTHTLQRHTHRGVTRNYSTGPDWPSHLILWRTFSITQISCDELVTWKENSVLTSAVGSRLYLCKRGAYRSNSEQMVEWIKHAHKNTGTRNQDNTHTHTRPPRIEPRCTNKGNGIVVKKIETKAPNTY